MSKTPPLVIPVVIDGRGVDRGLNNINSRLRRGVGGGGTGVGTDLGTFGSGGVAAGAIAGAIAAGGGGGARTVRYHIGKNENPSVALENIRNYRMRQETWWGRAWNSPIRRIGHWKGSMTNAIQSGGGAGEWSSSTLGSGPRNLDSEMLQLRSARRNLQRLGGAARFMGNAPHKFNAAVGGMFDDIKRSRGLSIGGFGAVAGVAALAKGAVQMRNNISGMNIDNLAGSPMWGQMRKMQLRDFAKGANPTGFQSMLSGSSFMSGGKETRLERIGDVAASNWGDMAFGIGMAIENPMGALRAATNPITWMSAIKSLMN